MLQSPEKIFVLGLIACIAAIAAPVRTVTGAESRPAEIMLQPKALNHTGIYALRNTDPALTGSGVKFAVISRSITYYNDEPQNDYRPSIGHNSFEAREFGFYDQGEPSPAISPHSTAICSILFGDDPYAYHPELGQFYYQGAVPQAEADVYEFWNFLIDNVFNHLPPDADVVTASVGSPLEDWWTRGIESLAEHYGLIVVSGIGNGLNENDPLLYPAAAANVIGVGVIDSVNSEDLTTNLSNFSLVYPDHSSLGPTSEGRCKPDIVAPGNCLAADVNKPDIYEPTGDWSSFSTPIVAGAVGLLVQKAKQDPALSAVVSPNGGNCVIKAILMNSATKLPYWHKGRLEKDDDNQVPLDYIQGAGMLNAVAAYEHLIAGRNKPGIVSTTGWDLNQLDKGEYPQSIYELTLPETANKFITITAVWNRHYNYVYPFEPIPERDTNFRLELWAVDPRDSGKDYLLDYSDSSVDNVEHIYCRADANYTNYEIVISHDQMQTGETQHYGLSWNVSDAPNSDSISWYDLNADGIVDKLDFTVVFDNWIASIQSPESYLIGDINSNGVFDVNDLQIFSDNKDRKADWYSK
jgi:hypothetical protein